MDEKRAYSAAEKYCKKEGLSVEKLRSLYRQIISGNLYFVLFPDVKPNGLKNDLETRGISVLKVTKDCVVEETERTRVVLS